MGVTSRAAGLGGDHSLHPLDGCYPQPDSTVIQKTNDSSLPTRGILRARADADERDRCSTASRRICRDDQNSMYYVEYRGIQRFQHD